MSLLEGKTVLVTGAGRGVGRAHAMEIARQGARVVVNDLGVSITGGGGDTSVAEKTVAVILAAGGTAIANHDDISTWEGARRAVQAGLDTYGGLDGLVNNAGILRSAELADVTEDDFDALVAVHMKGSFACAIHALSYWRGETQAGRTVQASIINTFSEAVLIHFARHSVYSAVKAAVIQLTTVGSREAEAYGVRLNAYGPRALTRMSEASYAGVTALETDKPHPKNPGNSSPLVVWLLSDQSTHVTGQIFQTVGGGVARCEPLSAGPMNWPEDGAFRFTPTELGRRLNSEVFGSRIRDATLAEPPGWSADLAT